MEDKDLPKFLNIRNSSVEFLHCSKTFNLTEASKWFHSLPNSKWYDVILYEGEIIGYFRLEDKSTEYCKELQIGADLHPNFIGKGLAYKSYKLYIKSKNEYEYFSLDVLGSNTRAFSLYVKLGFRIIYTEVIERNGKFEPSIHMIYHNSPLLFDKVE